MKFICLECKDKITLTLGQRSVCKCRSSEFSVDKFGFYNIQGSGETQRDYELNTIIKEENETK